MNQALVFNIQGFSIQDGPGVRTTIFLKGCPLHCLWCANPESQLFCCDLLHTRSKCVKCFRCAAACRHGAVTLPADPTAEDAFPVFDHKRCIDCADHSCVNACHEAALETVGKLMSVEDVMDRVLSDEPFFRKSGGGVTVSGGEPLCHPEFVEELFAECKDNYIHTCIETTGFCDWEKFKKVLAHTDLVLYDLKHMDPAEHKRLTGVDNHLIKENLKKLVNETSVNVVVRIPTIPGLNDSEENMEATAAYMREIGAGKVHLLPYHRMGMGKYEGIGRDYLVSDDTVTPSNERMEQLRAIFQARGLSCYIGGAEGY